MYPLYNINYYYLLKSVLPQNMSGVRFALQRKHGKYDMMYTSIMRIRHDICSVAYINLNFNII